MDIDLDSPEYVRPIFDEEWYLRVYPDVADAVRMGDRGTAWDHFASSGKSEGRLPAPPQELADFWEKVRDRFPDHSAGYLGLARALRRLERPDDADVVLSEARLRFPEDVDLTVEHAWVAVARNDAEQALGLTALVREMAPNQLVGYLGATNVLRSLHRREEAEVLLREAKSILPDNSRIAADFARIAEENEDWEEAGRRWRDFSVRFPHTSVAPAGEAVALRQQGEWEASDTVLEAAMFRFPAEPGLAEHYARNAMMQENWALALTRLNDAMQRFPDVHALRHRLFEVQLRIADAGGQPAPVPFGAENDPNRDLIMNFESLGGGGHGCEFGIFQRSVGAEPLGLLRWADLDHRQLTLALNNEFAGVGEPEFTTIFVPPNNPDYWTIDTRYHMAMVTHVSTKAVTMERMGQLMRQRMGFLARKLMDDLRAGEKIFVYKNLKQNLTDDELKALHDAVRRYGDNMLFYIRYEDAGRPNGTVELRAPGLMVGYIDHFSHAPVTDKSLGHAHIQFLALCRKAYDIWSAGRAGETTAMTG